MHPIEVGFQNRKHSRIQKLQRDFSPPAFVLLFLPCPLPPAPRFTIPASLEWNPPTFVTRCSKHFQLLSPGAPNISKYCHQVLQIFRILSSSLLDKKNSPKVPATVAGRMPCNQISIITCITGFTLFEIVLFLLVVFINSKF